MLRNAPFYFLTDLVADFHAARPGVRVRIVGQNSYEVAEAVRFGDLEAGLVVLPVPDEGLDIRPLIRDEVLWVSADPRHVLCPVTMEQVAMTALILYDAHYGWNDPTRRQLADRAQAAGGPARVVSSRAARRSLCRAVLRDHRFDSTTQLHLSPGTVELAQMATTMLRAVPWAVPPTQ